MAIGSSSLPAIVVFVGKMSVDKGFTKKEGEKCECERGQEICLKNQSTVQAISRNIERSFAF